MNATVLKKQFYAAVSIETKLIAKRHRWANVLTASAAAASVTGLFGLSLAGASLLHLIPSNSSLSLYGNLLLTITFPLLIFAAHCLDKIDNVNAAIRAAKILNTNQDR